MAPSDLQMLLEMGFAEDKAKLAVKQTGSLQDAVDWLDKNADKTIEELTSDDGPPGDDVGEARSLVCNDCGKKFRNQAQAEYHATKSGHTDFSESAEEVKPLTEEEKAAKLEELKSKLAAKRAQVSEQDKLDKKKNEEIRRKATKESQDIREALQQKERIKEAEKKRREKRDEELARKKVLDQIAADRAERKRKADLEKAQRAGGGGLAELATGPVPAAAVPATQPASKPASSYTETRLRLQTPGGTVVKSFPVDTTLLEVSQALQKENGTMVTSFTQNFPRKVFDTSDFGQTLKEAGMVPSAALVANGRRVALAAELSA
ncbi:hypothetical protein EJ06DRAFT_531518 [Trichodelitschia bisporula]|uniref:C2H2-type domain-containing protein n=1 Tax=Trichodelitschia bisporula TaxID=703511 RepID=A0A6G1HTK1_9PEZI|nr:hypothetical protein EJ06DRAFT_531518 [Trichodelitschia bisporula]